MLANIAVHAVSMYQVSYAELPEPARSHRCLASLSLWPGLGVPALSVFVAACLKFFHLETTHSQIVPELLSSDPSSIGDARPTRNLKMMTGAYPLWRTIQRGSLSLVTWPKDSDSYGNPRLRLMFLNFLRLEAGDSSLQTRVPELRGVKGLSSMRPAGSACYFPSYHLIVRYERIRSLAFAMFRSTSLAAGARSTSSWRS